MTLEWNCANIVLMTEIIYYSQRKRGNSMPKIVGESERQRIKDAMQNAVIQLIKQKSIRKITVEEITQVIGIGKGSFYLYYESKELLFYSVVKFCEQNMIDEIFKIQNLDMGASEKVHKVMYEMYLAPDSIMLYLSPADMDWLIRKLPTEYFEYEQKKSDINFNQILSFFHIDSNKLNVEVISALMEAVNYVASDAKKYSPDTKQEALNILVTNVSDYILTACKE